MQVQHRDSGEIFALKTMRKNHVVQVPAPPFTHVIGDRAQLSTQSMSLLPPVVVQKNDVVGVRTERSVLTRIRHPFIIKLKCAFHTPEVRISQLINSSSSVCIDILCFPVSPDVVRHLRRSAFFV